MKYVYRLVIYDAQNSCFDGTQTEIPSRLFRFLIFPSSCSSSFLNLLLSVASYYSSFTYLFLCSPSFWAFLGSHGCHIFPAINAVYPLAPLFLSLIFCLFFLLCFPSLFSLFLLILSSPSPLYKPHRKPPRH